MLMLQVQGWDFTPSSPPCPPLRGTSFSIAVAKKCLEPVGVLRGLLLEEGVLLRLRVLVVVLVFISLVCREGREGGGRTEELKLLEGERVSKKLFPGMPSPFLLQLAWDTSGSRARTVWRTEGAVQLFLGMRGQNPPGTRPGRHRAPPDRCWRVLGPWLLSQFPRWQPGCPGGDAGGGLCRHGHEPPRTAPQPGEVLMAVTGTVRKGDLDSYEKKGFSLSSCFDRQHRRRRRARQDLHQHVGACCPWGHRNPFWAKSEGNEGPRHPHAYVAPRPQSPCRGARAGHSGDVPKNPTLPPLSLQPPSSQRPPREPGAGRTRSFASPRLGGSVD